MKSSSMMGSGLMGSGMMASSSESKKYKDMSDVVGALTNKLHNSIADIKIKPSKQCEPAPYCPGDSGCGSDDYSRRGDVPCYGCNL